VDTLVRVLKAVVCPISSRVYYVGLVGDAEGSRQLLTTVPSSNTHGRTACRHPKSVGAYVKGRVGIFPAKNAGFFYPFFTPNIVYKYRLGETAPMMVTGRQTLTNVEEVVLGS